MIAVFNARAQFDQTAGVIRSVRLEGYEARQVIGVITLLRERHRTQAVALTEYVVQADDGAVVRDIDLHAMTGEVRIEIAAFVGEHPPVALGLIVEAVMQHVAYVQRKTRQHFLEDTVRLLWRRFNGDVERSDTHRRAGLDGETRFPVLAALFQSGFDLGLVIADGSQCLADFLRGLAEQPAQMSFGFRW